MLAITENNLGFGAQLSGDLKSALSWQRKALEIESSQFPNSLNLASTYQYLCVVEEAQGDLTQSEIDAKRAMEIRARLEPNSVEIAGTFISEGILSKIEEIFITPGFGSIGRLT